MLKMTEAEIPPPGAGFDTVTGTIAKGNIRGRNSGL